MVPDRINECHFLGSTNFVLCCISRFSRVRLCATPWTAAYQASPSMGFSRQEHWSGLPFPPPMHKSESEVAQSCQNLSDPMDCSLPGSSIHGIFQARVLEWGAIAFSQIYGYPPLNFILKNVAQIWAIFYFLIRNHLIKQTFLFNHNQYCVTTGLPRQWGLF